MNHSARTKTKTPKRGVQGHHAPGGDPRGGAPWPPEASPSIRLNAHCSPIREWRVDEDGNLRVTAVVLKEGVYSYEDLGLGFEYIPASEMTPEALATLEGRPVITDEHTWRDADNTIRDGLTKGAVAGAPRAGHGEIVCDFLIQDRETAKAVMDGKLVEVSAAYVSERETGGGEWEGKPFDATQRNFRFNHILLCPPGQKGRLGPAVRIINSNKERSMNEKTCTIERRVGNSVKSYRFFNADDAETAKEMADESARVTASEAEEALRRMNELGEEKSALEAELAKAAATIEEFKAQIEAALSPEALEEAAGELAEQAETIEAIVEEEIAENERETLNAVVKSGKTMAGRRAELVKAVMRANSVDASAWSQEQIDGSFHTLGLKARAARAEQAARKPAPRLPNGGAQPRNNSEAPSAKDRMMAAYAGK